MFEFLGDKVVAWAWSFQDKLKDDPYILTYDVSRRNKWGCTCPSFVMRGHKTCKHLITMRTEVSDGVILSDDRYKISEYGKVILKL